MKRSRLYFLALLLLALRLPVCWGAAPRLTILTNGTDVVIQFQAEAGQTYSLLYETELGSGRRTRAADFAPASSQNLAVTQPITDQRRFYFVVSPRAVLPDDPQILSIQPEGLFAPPNSVISVALSHPVALGAVNSNSFLVTDDLGREVPGTITVFASGTTVQFIPRVPFASDTAFQVEAKPWLSEAGVLMAGTNAAFRTAASAPLVDDRSVYAQDVLAPVEVRLQVFPGEFTLEDVNNDIDNADDIHPFVNVLFQEGTYGQGLTGPNATLEQRGASARFSGQKSYKVRLTGNRWRGHRVLNLNKHPYDLTRIRNKLSFDLFQGIPHLSSLRTMFARLTVDAVDYGLFTQVEEPNDRFLSTHGFDGNGHLYKANFFEFFRYEDQLKLEGEPGHDPLAYERIIEPKVGDGHEKLLTMLDDVNDASIPINRVIAKHFNRDNYLTWFAVNIVLGNIDTASQNFFLYSPRTSRTWYFLPWDYDGAWDWYNQPDQAPLAKARAKEGLPNWWGGVLHRRFLREPENVAALTNRVNELLHNYFGRTQVEAKLNAYLPQVLPIATRPPDAYELPLRGPAPAEEQFTNELQRLAAVPAANVAKFFATLSRPMPIFLGTPITAEGVTHFVWDASFSLDGNPLTYDLEVSRTPRFAAEDLVARVTGLTGTSHTISPALGSGTHYYRVLVRDEVNGADAWQQPFDAYYDPVADRVHPGMQQFTIP